MDISWQISAVVFCCLVRALDPARADPRFYGAGDATWQAPLRVDTKVLSRRVLCKMSDLVASEQRLVCYGDASRRWWRISTKDWASDWRNRLTMFTLADGAACYCLVSVHVLGARSDWKSAIYWIIASSASSTSG